MDEIKHYTDNVVPISTLKIESEPTHDELLELFDFLKELEPDDLMIIAVKGDDVLCASSSFSSRLKMLGATSAINNFMCSRGAEEGLGV